MKILPGLSSHYSVSEPVPTSASSTTTDQASNRSGPKLKILPGLPIGRRFVPTTPNKSAEYLFVCTNELGQKEAQTVWTRVSPPGNTVIGCGGFTLLNLAASKSSITRIAAFDIDPRFQSFWNDINDIFKEARTRKAMKIALASYLRLDPGATASLKYEIDSNVSFLSSDPGFIRVQAIFDNKRVSFDNIDFFDSTVVSDFFDSLRRIESVAACVFLSNIREFVTHTGVYHQGVEDHRRYEHFERSLNLIPSESFIIDAQRKTHKDAQGKLQKEEFASQTFHIRGKDLAKLMPPPCKCLLQEAIEQDNYTLVQKYHKAGNLSSKLGHTNLMIAVNKSKPEAARALLDCGEDVNACDSNQFTALHAASACGSRPVIELLLTRGATLEARDDQLMTPLHQAAVNGHYEAVQALVVAGADRISRDIAGYTPLALTTLKQCPAYNMRTTNPSGYRFLQQLLDLTTSSTSSSSSTGVLKRRGL